MIHDTLMVHKGTMSHPPAHGKLLIICGDARVQKPAQSIMAEGFASGQVRRRSCPFFD